MYLAFGRTGAGQIMKFYPHWGVDYELCASASFAESFSDHRHHRWARPVPHLIFWKEQRPETRQLHRFRRHCPPIDSYIPEWLWCTANDQGARRVGRFASEARRLGAAVLVVYRG